MYLAQHRPTTFGGIVGQPEAIQGLKSIVASVDEGNAPPPFLLLVSSDPGTGKTTAARVFAAAINCTERGAELEPCGACPDCQAALSPHATQTQAPVVEVDAATYNTVDHMRELLSKTSRSIRAKYRVVIMDEAHSLSNRAQDMMLKPLEEPGRKVITIWVTTQKQALLPTIVSRATVLEFGPISEEVIAKTLTETLDREGITDVDPSVIQRVSVEARGSLRNALTTLGSAVYSGQSGVAVAGGGLDHIVSAVMDDRDFVRFLVACDDAAAETPVNYMELLFSLNRAIRDRLVNPEQEMKRGEVARWTRALADVSVAVREAQLSSAPQIIVEGVVAKILGTDFGDVSRRRDQRIFDELLSVGDMVEAMMQAQGVELDG